MRKGFLSQYFEGVAIKRLTNVEVNTKISNQHEFNGSKPLRELLGDNRSKHEAHFLWLSGENEAISAEGKVTWYDTRENQPKRSPEYRLYFNPNDVMNQAREGDLLIIAKRPREERIFIIVSPKESTLENQLLWLFGIEQIGFKFGFQPIENGHDPQLDFTVRYILEELGIETEESDTEKLDYLLKPYFTTGFPSTAVFSSLARESVTDVSPLEEVDHTLLSWMEQEEKLFKRLERFIVAKKLEEGFQAKDYTDVDGFIKFSLSVHNRRKSRVGYALENHLEEIFKIHKISYSRGKVTENKSKPDFTFPTIVCYHNEGFPSSRLTMLGVKSTCKDRWRQVLTEAARIHTKHLFTLEPGISNNQTEEMKENNIQLVLPESLHNTYKPNQRSWLMNLDSFIELVTSRQNT